MRVRQYAVQRAHVEHDLRRLAGSRPVELCAAASNHAPIVARRTPRAALRPPRLASRARRFQVRLGSMIRPSHVIPLHPLGDAGELGGMTPIRARDLAAQSRRREDLARVAQARGIERRPDSQHHTEVVGREHRRHVLRLVGADAVLAGERTAGLDAIRQDLRRDLDRSIGLARARSRRSKSTDAGCRLPRERRCRSAVRIAPRVAGCGSSTSGSRVRGTTPSWT